MGSAPLVKDFFQLLLIYAIVEIALSLQSLIHLFTKFTQIHTSYFSRRVKIRYNNSLDAIYSLYL